MKSDRLYCLQKPNSRLENITLCVKEHTISMIRVNACKKGLIRCVLVHLFPSIIVDNVDFAFYCIFTTGREICRLKNNLV